MRITRKFEWDSGHRVLGHEGKCRHLHGHRYVAEVTVEAPELDMIGRVIDFSELKSIIGGWIDTQWDHNILLHEADPLLDVSPESSVWGGKKPYIMLAGNPTAENMVQILFNVASNLLPRPMKVVHCRIYETPNCWADYSGE